MPRYLIQGEVGKTLDATPRELGNELVAVNASLRFESLGMDRLSWTARTIDLDAGETILPDVGQMVELFYDTGSGAVRLFRGWVTEARAKNYGTIVVVDGPWQWLQKLTAQTSKTLNGTTDTRPTIDIAAGSLSVRIASVLAAAIADGAPITWGGMTAAYSVHALKIPLASYADVIADLLRWVPDAVVSFDYATAPTGHAILNIYRRAAMGTQTFPVGSGGEAIDYQANGRPDLVPSRVELKYIERGTDERPVYKVQASGTAALGRTQVILVSGDENDTFLPRDNYDSYVVQTSNANATLSNTRAALLPLIPEVAASRQAWSNRPASSDVILANGETITLQRSTNGNLGTFIYPQPALQFLDAETGEPVSRTGKHFLLGAIPPEWAEGVVANAQRVKIRGRIYRLEETTLVTNSGTGIDAPALPNWSVAFPWSQYVLLNGYYPSNTQSGYPWARVWLAALDFEVETILTTTNQSVPTTIYRPQDFEYLSPASGLAANLLAAQNFVPVDGFLEFQSATPPAGPPALHQLTNISGAQASVASMAAMRRAVSLDLLKFTSRIELGSPARFDFKTLVGSLRTTPQTNIAINP